MNDYGTYRTWHFGLTIAIIVMICGIIYALPGMVQAGQSGEGLPFLASKLPDLSGLVWMEDDLFLAVHDAKNPEEIERPRASLIQLPNGPDGISWKQLNLQLTGEKSNDLESTARIPGTQQVLLVESTQKESDKPSSRRIILAELFHKRLRIIDVIEWPTKTTNVEGTAVAQIEDRLIFVYAERAEGLASTDIIFADIELDPLSFGEFEKLGTFTNPDWPRTNRPVTAMDMDSDGWLYVASAFDPGHDNGPFRSVVWKAGRIIRNTDTDKPELVLDPVQLAVLDGVKVESVAVRQQNGSGFELFVGLDDENYGGTMRPLNLGTFGWAVGRNVDGYGPLSIIGIVEQHGCGREILK